MTIQPRMLRSMVSISQFSKGQAARVFERLQTEPQLIVLKNNAPAAVLLSPEEYTRLAEMEEDYLLLLEAQKRLQGDALAHAVPEAEALASLGLTEADIAGAEEPEIE